MTGDHLPPCLAFVLKEEGGFSNDPQDSGGATNLGITIGELRQWRNAPVSIADVKTLTTAEAAAIYRASYWQRCRCDALPPGLDLIVFDSHVNTGHGARWLQAAAGVPVDGVVGPITIAAVGKGDTAMMIDAIADARRAYYRQLQGYPRFGNGWMGRVDRCQVLAHSMTNLPPPVIR